MQGNTPPDETEPALAGGHFPVKRLINSQELFR
jgi:hypothetical protein